MHGHKGSGLMTPEFHFGSVHPCLRNFMSDRSGELINSQNFIDLNRQIGQVEQASSSPVLHGNSLRQAKFIAADTIDW